MRNALALTRKVEWWGKAVLTSSSRPVMTTHAASYPTAIKTRSQRRGRYVKFPLEGIITQYSRLSRRRIEMLRGGIIEAGKIGG